MSGTFRLIYLFNYLCFGERMPYLSHASCASTTVRDTRRPSKPVEAGLAADKLRLLCGMKAFQSYSEPRRLPTVVVYAVVRPSSLSFTYESAPSHLSKYRVQYFSDCVDRNQKGFDPYSTTSRENYLKTLAIFFFWGQT